MRETEIRSRQPGPPPSYPIPQPSRPILQPGLSLRDVAQALGTNVRYIFDSINSSTGASFSDYINGYRVRHAQALMQDRPGMPLSEFSRPA